MINSGPTQLALAVNKANENTYSPNIAAQAGHLALASVVDFGTAVYNSIDLFDVIDDADTEGVLDGLGLDSTADFYNDNKNLVEGVSFFGGLLVPGMLAVRGSQMLRAGLKGSNFLSPMKTRSQLREASRLIRNGKQATLEYRNVKLATYRNAIAQGVVDNAAAEIAILGSLNAHPLMEDYMEDLPTNFALSLAFGSALGAGIDIIATRRSLNLVAGHTLARAHTPVLEALPVRSALVGEGTEFRATSQAIKELDSINGNPKYSPETRSFARATADTLAVESRRNIEKIISPTKVNTADTEFAEHAETILNRSESAGVERLSFFSAADSRPTGAFQRLTNLIRETVTREGDRRVQTSGIYSPQFGMYLDEASANRIAGAIDAGQTQNTLTQSAKQSVARREHTKGRSNALTYTQGTSAEVDSEYLTRLLAFDELSLADLGRVNLHQDDLASLQGVAARVARERDDITALEARVGELREPRADGTVSSTNETKAVRLEASIAGRQRQLEQLRIPVIDDSITEASLRARGISRNHLGQVQTASRNLTNLTDDVSPELSGVLQRWFNGEAGVDEAIRTEVANLLRTGRSTSPAVRELLSSDHANRVRESLSSVADRQGFVHLLPNRLKATEQGFQVQTYTAVARADARTTPVAVNNIIGMQQGPDGLANFLAVDSTRAVVRQNLTGLRLDDQGFIQATNTNATADTIAGIAEERTAAWVIQQSRAALDEGFGIEELARRSNLEVDSVKRLLGSPNTETLAEGAMTSFRYQRAADIAEYTSNRQRLLRATDNGNQATYADYIKGMQVGLDRKALEEWATSTTLDLMSTSQSNVVRNLMEGYGAGTVEGQANLRVQKSLLKRGLNAVNDELASGRFFTSADQFTRNLGDAGRLINYFGDKFTQAYNKTVEGFVSPMNASLTKIAADDAQIVALNTAIQVHRSIGDGTIRFRAGQFEVQKVGQEVFEPVLWQGSVFKVPAEMPAVSQFLEQAAKAGEELQNARVTRAKLTGGIAPSSKGFWIPNFDLRTKDVEFVRFPDGRQMILTGRNAEELGTKKQALIRTTQEQLEFITPAQRDQFNYLRGLGEDGNLRSADVLLQRGGSLATPFPTATLEEARGVINSLSDQLFSHAKNTHAILFDDELSQLRQIEEYATRFTQGQAQGPIRRAIGDPVKAATSLREALLGSRGQLSNYVGWDKTNAAFESLLTGAMSKWNDISERFALSRGNVAERYANLQRDLEAAGIPYPYAAFDAKLGEELFHTEAKPADARRIIAAGNGLAATMALRFLELAQPLVNMMSLPIMSYAAASHRYDKSFLGYTKQGGQQWPLRYMMDGVRSMHDTRYDPLFKKAEEQGLFAGIVSEATEAIKVTRLRERGALSRAEAALDQFDKGLLGKTTAASDYSESLSRKVAFATGVQLGKSLYGFKEGIDDAAILIFGKDFMDRAIGNYSASQRPVMFHGTAGAAIGLFQTYMVTFAQNIYRQVETRDFKAIAGTLGTQAGIFGVGGLPGYDQVSQYIGEHYSENHTDLTTGLYRAVDDPAANAILYGLPSSLGGLVGLAGSGPNVSSRGAIDPRFPIITGEAPAAAGTLIDSITALTNIGSRIAQSSPEESGTAFLEALSMQSVSRPLARLAEIGSGHSVTRAGHTVQTPEEVYTSMGILARVLGTRPTDEVKVRDATHLNTYYGSLDRENRSTAMLRIRQAIRENSVTNGLVDEVATEYVGNGGTPQGFRSALNQAMQAESVNLDTQLHKALTPESPIINMLTDL